MYEDEMNDMLLTILEAKQSYKTSKQMFETSEHIFNELEKSEIYIDLVSKYMKLFLPEPYNAFIKELQDKLKKDGLESQS